MKNSLFWRRWAAAVLLALTAVSAGAASGVTLVHVHGLAFSPDGKQLFIPSHVGMAIYSEGRWSKAPGPEHDFMGFSATRAAIYSSGHPAPGSTIKNPFGLLKSTDGGKSWEHLGLGGEADFHVMAASHATSMIYVYAPVRNSRMPQPGIYYTADDGKTWKPSAGEGLAGRIAALAAHPARGAVVAAATDAGLYLSADHGNTFTAAAVGVQATAAYFDLDGAQLWYGGYNDGATLAKWSLKTRKREAVTIPAITKDAVAYIAQNPVKRSQYAIATFTRHVYFTEDNGKHWKQIAVHGQTR